MDVRYEAILRSVGVFTSVYFTLSWGGKSKPTWDTQLMLAGIALAIILHFIGK